MSFARYPLLVGCLFSLFVPQVSAVAPRLGPGPRSFVKQLSIQNSNGNIESHPFHADLGKDGAPSSESSGASQKQAYSLSAEKLAKAIALGRIRQILGLIGSLLEIAVYLLLLATGAASGLERWSQRVFHRRWMQGLIFFAVLIALVHLAYLPLGIYGHHVSLSFGISVQGWGSWFVESLKGLGVALFGALGFLLFNWIVRVSPRRYWFWAWMVSLPLMVLIALGAPLLEPVFNKFEPLIQSHPGLVARLEQVVARTGTNIPPQRMFLMKASLKTNSLNAYVSGIGATKRFVLWDTTTDRLPDDEILFIFGHESGHYVLNHIPKGLACSAVGGFFVLWACAGLAGAIMRRYGSRWRIESLSDRAGFVVLLLTLSVAQFVSEPVGNAVSRHFEHEADVYGQEAIHGIVADPQKAAVAAFNHLGEASLDDPNPNAFIEFWTYSHPSVEHRAEFALHYDPWASGRKPQFF